jgi:hypothetical protein
VPNLTPNHDGNQAQSLVQNAIKRRLLLLTTMLGMMALATTMLVSQSSSQNHVQSASGWRLRTVVKIRAHEGSESGFRLSFSLYCTCWHYRVSIS